MNENELMEQLDAHVATKYNVAGEQVASMIVDNNKVVYFRDGIPFVEFRLFETGISWRGPQITVEEFEYKNKLL